MTIIPVTKQSPSNQLFELESMPFLPVGFRGGQPRTQVVEKIHKEPMPTALLPERHAFQNKVLYSLEVQ